MRLSAQPQLEVSIAGEFLLYDGDVNVFRLQSLYREYQSEVDAVNNMSWTDDMDNDDAASASAAASTAKPSAKPADSATPTIRKCPGHESSFSVEETIQELDIPEQNIETLLCYLELHEQRYIQVLSKAYTRCKVMAYGGPAVLKAVSRTCAPLAMAIALDLKRGISHNESTLIEFCVIDIASAIGWDSGIVKYQLKNLEWTTGEYNKNIWYAFSTDNQQFFRSCPSSQWSAKTFHRLGAV